MDQFALTANCWQELATRVLDGHRLDVTELLSILRAPDEAVPDLLAAAFRVRRHYFGTDVQLYYLENAKSGLCPEDCNYCSQSAVSDAPVERYSLLDAERLLEGARQAASQHARTYCIVASGRGPSDAEIEQIAGAVRTIKTETDLHICCCLGLLDSSQARSLKDAGVDRINHNLNTSQAFYDSICSTHTYQQRLETLEACREAGLELCCGLIVGMGESDNDVAAASEELHRLRVESIPVNFLNPIPGTPLEDSHRIEPVYCLKVLAMFRLGHPDTEIRIAGGREVNLRSLQPLGLYAANSLFVSDYLTTAGQPAAEDIRTIEDLGFRIVGRTPAVPAG